ncbi:hypothetical protein [Paenibacillus turpanensis]|uniref:hypothetical protein n=1 Tax=Paenibacillus turpanensis TaxID=2689078 RepID=UPI00140ACF77|nr:hypothetical protein [Paenibacillus turpanensis]
MNEVSLSTLNEEIEKVRPEVTAAILARKQGPTYIRRSRSEDEVQILHEICRRKWEQAVQSGKIKYLSEREIFYALD